MDEAQRERPPRRLGPAVLAGLAAGLLAWTLLRPWDAHLPLPWMLALGALGGLAAAARRGATGAPARRGAWDAAAPRDAPHPEERPANEEEASPVSLELGDSLDLHAFRPEDVQEVVRAYLEEARAAGLSAVRVVHGKGRGVQRRLVHAVLADHPAVAGWEQDGGNWGATLVRLRRAGGGG